MVDGAVSATESAPLRPLAAPGADGLKPTRLIGLSGHTMARLTIAAVTMLD